MSDQLVTRLLPILLRRPAVAEFNVFDVMRHGTHEKQVSNVFAWLLDAEGTHRLGDAFQHIFIDEVNRALGDDPVPEGAYSVRQEVNTSEVGEAMDIADLVVEDEATVMVVENYYASDGHGHSYERYLKFGTQGGQKRSIVVMLCGSVNRADLIDGWQNAAVVTYSSLVDRLVERVDDDEAYQIEHPQQCSFFRQMHRHFVGGRRVNDDDLIRFIDAMCETGEARRYQANDRKAAGLNFADVVREQALERFDESRDLLQRLKKLLKAHAAQVLCGQVNEALGADYLLDAFANYQGIYQWTILFKVPDGGPAAPIQLKFGPSAWYANEKDGQWRRTVAAADYSRVFLTDLRTMEVKQSAVTLQDVLDGLRADDYRLRDEVVGLLREARS